MTSQLGEADLRFASERVFELITHHRQSPGWGARILDAIDPFLWALAVDAAEGNDQPRVIRKDAWVPSGQALREHHFSRVPHTTAAWQAFQAGDRKNIKREHVVPRATLKRILIRLASVDDTVRVLSHYSQIALVTDEEATRLVPTSDMPPDWAIDVDWTGSLPGELPDPWARYRGAGVVPRHSDGRRAYEP